MFKQDNSKAPNGFGIIDLILLIVLLSVIFVSIYKG